MDEIERLDNLPPIASGTTAYKKISGNGEVTTIEVADVELANVADEIVIDDKGLYTAVAPDNGKSIYRYH